MGQEIAGLCRADTKTPQTTKNHKQTKNPTLLTPPKTKNKQTKNPNLRACVFVFVTLSNIELYFSVPPFLEQKYI